MKQTLFIITLLALVLSSWTFSDWTYFTSAEGRFKIFAPSELQNQEQIQAIETSLGTLEYHTFYHQPTKGETKDFIFILSYVDYPDALLLSDSTDLVNEFFSTTIEAASENLNGELKYENPLELSDYPGRIWRIDYNEGEAIMKTKAYVVGNRYYSLQVAVNSDKRFNSHIDLFLNSFELLTKGFSK